MKLSPVAYVTAADWKNFTIGARIIGLTGISDTDSTVFLVTEYVIVDSSSAAKLHAADKLNKQPKAAMKTNVRITDPSWLGAGGNFITYSWLGAGGNFITYSGSITYSRIQASIANLKIISATRFLACHKLTPVPRRMTISYKVTTGTVTPMPPTTPQQSRTASNRRAVVHA